jgi:hypothetical protein
MRPQRKVNRTYFKFGHNSANRIASNFGVVIEVQPPNICTRS